MPLAGEALRLFQELKMNDNVKYIQDFMKKISAGYAATELPEEIRIMLQKIN